MSGTVQSHNMHARSQLTQNASFSVAFPHTEVHHIIGDIAGFVFTRSFFTSGYNYATRIAYKRCNSSTRSRSIYKSTCTHVQCGPRNTTRATSVQKSNRRQDRFALQYTQPPAADSLLHERLVPRHAIFSTRMALCSPTVGYSSQVNM